MPIVSMDNKNPCTVTIDYVMPPLSNDEMSCSSIINDSSICTSTEEARIPKTIARTKPEDNDTTGNNKPTAFVPTGTTDTIRKDNLPLLRGRVGLDNLEPITPEVTTGINKMINPDQSEE